MTDYMGILCMKAKGFSARSISSSLQTNKRTVLDCINRAESAGITFPFAEGISNESLFEMLYRKSSRRDERYALPDFALMDEELKKPTMTLMLLWNRYFIACKAKGSLFYQHTQFCELYRRHLKNTGLSVRIDRNPGESLELDWCGEGLYLYDPITDERIKTSLFVATFSFSGYFYSEAFTDQKVRSWIMANEHALQFFGGVPLLLIPDNLKTAVIKADRYEPELHEAFLEFADHYQTVIMPARVRKPKDKPNVEGAVGFITRRIIADLQDRKFFTLDELNQAIWERMDALNAGPFTKKPGSRSSLFEEVEKQHLSPLPSLAFQYYERKMATVAPDFHIEFDKSWYSVSWNYVRQKVLVKATASTVLVFDEQGIEIARHTRSLYPGQKSTNPDHLPANIREVSNWNSATFRRRAASIGPSTEAVIERILASREYEVQSYRTCLGVLNLVKNVDKDALEQACVRAVELGIRSRKGIKAILSAMEMETEDTRTVTPRGERDDDLQRFYCCHEDDHGKSFVDIDGEAAHGDR